MDTSLQLRSLVNLTGLVLSAPGFGCGGFCIVKCFLDDALDELLTYIQAEWW